MIVADTNLVTYLLIDSEHTHAARAVRARDPEWRLPPLWRAEFLNVLTSCVRGKVLEAPQAHAAWRHATDLFGKHEHEPTGDAVLTVAIRDGLSAYDAQFVVVAESLGIRLVTGDKRIITRRPDLAVSLEDFAAGS